MNYICGSLRSVDTGDTYFSEIINLSISGSGEAKHKLQRDGIKRIEVYDSKPLEARIEHARFIVDCPNCNSAEFAFEDGLFYCSLCNNSDVGGKARKVKIPNERKQIEAVLAKRQITNRHWYPAETIQDLENENISHGLEVI